MWGRGGVVAVGEGQPRWGVGRGRGAQEGSGVSCPRRLGGQPACSPLPPQSRGARGPGSLGAGPGKPDSPPSVINMWCCRREIKPPAGDGTPCFQSPRLTDCRGDVPPSLCIQRGDTSAVRFGRVGNQGSCFKWVFFPHTCHFREPHFEIFFFFLPFLVLLNVRSESRDQRPAWG